MDSLAGKRILVTGASSGIGKAVAHEAARLGASLVLIARNKERLNETFHSLTGNNHQQYILDITDYSQLEEIIVSDINKNGSISGFVHSAGIEKTLPFKASKNSVFKEVFETNVFAGFEIARIISKKNMFDSKGASFVFMSSVKGKIGDIGNVVYCSSKSALLAGSKAMALELAPKNIRCNCVLPGIVETEMVAQFFESIPTEARDRIVAKHPLGLGKPDDVAALIAFLLSDSASWITGGEYVIDGGYSAQ